MRSSRTLPRRVGLLFLPATLTLCGALAGTALALPGPQTHAATRTGLSAQHIGPATSATRLTVTVRPQGAAGHTRTRVIACPPSAGSGMCRRLQRLQARDLAPVSDDTACTALYGGPATARLRGRLHGDPVSARFDLHNGCEIARWQRLAWLLGDPPTQVATRCRPTR